MRSLVQSLTIGTTLGVMGLASATALHAQSPSVLLLAQANDLVWHNCLTREVWSPEKQVWCRQVDIVQNLTYDLPQFGTVALNRGQYEQSAPDVLRVTLLKRPYTIAFGNLEDGTAVAAVMLVVNSGGTGNFVHLAVSQDQGDGLSPVAATLLGDRVNIETVQWLNGQLQVDLISHGPDDPACCPTQPLRQIYRLEGDTLQLVSETTRTAAQAVPALY